MVNQRSCSRQYAANHDNEVIPAKQKIVQVYQYDVMKPDAANDPLKHTYCIRTNAGVCSNK